MLTPAQKETLRTIALETLALRHPTALRTVQITRRIASEIDFLITEQDTDAALEYLKGLNPSLVTVLQNELGPIKHWTATTDGVQAYEKSQPLT